MKEIFIKDILKMPTQQDIEICGWIKSIRVQKKITFITLVDSSSEIQIVCDGQYQELKSEMSVNVKGKTVISKGIVEILATKIDIIGDVELVLDPHPRKDFNIFANYYADNIMNNRHIYLRNPQLRAALKARDLVINALRMWFSKKGYCDVTAPILTPILLYSEDTGIKIKVNKQEIFLTQCVGFYLESAVHSLEKVYNIGPSFRGKETSSKRHLTEYWHVKSELAFCSFNEFFDEVEDMLNFITIAIRDEAILLCEILGTKFNEDALNAPFPRVTYKDALGILSKNKIHIDFGQSLNASAENFLSKYFNSSIWITNNPRSIEGFPYKIDLEDDRLTYTADLICSNEHGELLGIADKITDYKELETRLAEKGKDTNDSYQWFKDLRRVGTVPHCGMGMGLERLIKWLFDFNHVRDVIPFPRNIGRKIYP